MVSPVTVVLQAFTDCPGDPSTHRHTSDAQHFNSRTREQMPAK